MPTKHDIETARNRLSGVDVADVFLQLLHAKAAVNHLRAATELEPLLATIRKAEAACVALQSKAQKKGEDGAALALLLVEQQVAQIERIRQATEAAIAKCTEKRTSARSKIGAEDLNSLVAVARSKGWTPLQLSAAMFLYEGQFSSLGAGDNLVKRRWYGKPPKRKNT